MKQVVTLDVKAPRLDRKATEHAPKFVQSIFRKSEIATVIECSHHGLDEWLPFITKNCEGHCHVNIYVESYESDDLIEKLEAWKDEQGSTLLDFNLVEDKED